jgi:hypothetical protein
MLIIPSLVYKMSILLKNEMVITENKREWNKMIIHTI